MLRRYPWLLILFVAASCLDQKDYDLHAVNVSPAVVIPVVAGTLSVSDILSQKDSAYVKVDPDDLVYLQYSHVLLSTEIRHLFSIPDKTIHQSFTLVPGIIPAHNKDLRLDSVVEVIDLALNPAQLDQIDFKAGNIAVSAQLLPATSGLKFDVIFSSSDLISKTTGKTFSASVGSAATTLSDYKAVLNKNKFNVKMVLIVKSATAATNIGSNSSVAMDFSMTAMDFNSIHGFFGDRIVNPPAATLPISAFGNSLHNADVSFPQTTVTLSIVNDYGVPSEVTFQTFQVRKDGATLDGKLNPGNPVTLASPTVLGNSATTNVSVTNFQDLIDFGPNSFYYAISARINKGLTSGSDFLGDTSKLRVNLAVKIPLYGHAGKIILADTATLDLGKVDQSQVDQASLKVNMVNQLPLDANIQVYMTDDKYKIIDSLLTTTQTMLIKGSTVTAAGDFQSAGTIDQLIPLDRGAVNNLFTAKYLIIRSRMNTSKDAAGNPIDVKFKSKATLTVNVGLVANLNFNITF